MKPRLFLKLWMVTCATQGALSIGGGPPLGTAFTYQGRLEEAGVPANGGYAFVVRLFDAPTGGQQRGPTFCEDVVPIVNGLFTLQLDFGQEFAAGGDRYLDIQVSHDGDCAETAGFAQLSPRQRITATPLALHALRANVAEQAESAGLAEQAAVADRADAAFRLDAPDGSPASAVFVDNAGKVGVGTTTPTATLHVKGQGNTSPAGTPVARFMRGDADNFLAVFADIGGNYIVADDPTNNQKDLRLQTRNNRNILLEPHGTGKVYVRNEEPALILQDSGTAGDQWGYVSFLNNIGSTTAWVGFGSAGDPDFSVVNARPGGDINLLPLAGGRVGIGPHFATAGDENLRIIRGKVNSDGALLAGAGFTSVRADRGDYTITFVPPFAARPIITANVEAESEEAPTVDAAWAMPRVRSSSTASVVLVHHGNFLVDRTFYFIAIGPR